MLAAVASYLDAKAVNGQWLLRIEDVDRHRTVRGATEAICRSLEAHGLFWDGEIVAQTDRDARYEAALQKLAEADRIFYCNCTRKKLRAEAGPYAGHCRSRRRCNYQPATPDAPASHAIRFDTSGLASPVFHDRILGQQQLDLQALGDFIVRRRDSLFAYQLAVVVDDAEQGITDIVRGADLLESTPWQIVLQRVLGYSTPRYAHLPLLVHAKDGAKLSKQTGATTLHDQQASANLLRALAQLGQVLPPGNGPAVKQGGLPAPAQILAFATQHWDCSKIPRQPINSNEHPQNAH